MVTGSAPQIALAMAESHPPVALFIAHARARDRDWHRLCWRIDARMAHIALTAREGAVAEIRLAWWEEALCGGDGAQGRGEPTVDAWHAERPGDAERERVGRMAAGWRMLLDPAEMTETDWAHFGENRGALFALLQRSCGQTEPAAAKVWALWDAARIDPERQRAEGAFAAAIAAAELLPSTRPRGLAKPLRLALGMAMDDVGARRIPDANFTPRAWLRLLGRSILP